MFRRIVPLGVLALAITAQPSAAQRKAGFTPSPTDLIRSNIESALRNHADPVIQAELKLTAEQKAKIDKIPDELLAKHKDAIEKEEAANKEANEKDAVLRVDLEKKLDALVEKTLNTEQRKRLGQLVVQAMMGQAAGGFLFQGSDIAKTLSITDSQLAKLTEIQRAGTQKVQKEFGDIFVGNMDVETRQKYTAALLKMRQDSIAQFVETLSDEQKKSLKEMTGEPSGAVLPTTTTAFGGASIGGRFFSPSSRFYWAATLLRNDKALTELKVEKATQDAINVGLTAINEAGRVNRTANRGGFGGTIQATIGREAATLAQQALAEPQIKRLEQLQFQMNGTNVFTTANIGFALADGSFGFAGGGGRVIAPETRNLLAKLTLTPAQVGKIDAILSDTAIKTQELRLPTSAFLNRFGGGTETEEQKKVRLETLQKAADIDKMAIADILAIFDAGQKAAWNEMTGEPIDLSKFTTLVPLRGSPFGRKGGNNSISIVTGLTRDASLKTSRGEYAAALAIYDEAIRLAPNNPIFQQQKASLLASCPSEWVRDGKQSVEIARKLVDQTKQPTPGLYLILAAGYAECGQFDEAVKTQEKAISALPAPQKVDPADDTGFGTSVASRNAQTRTTYEARLKLYQEKKPYRMPLPKQAPLTGG